MKTSMILISFFCASLVHADAYLVLANSSRAIEIEFEDLETCQKAMKNIRHGGGPEWNTDFGVGGTSSITCIDTETGEVLLIDGTGKVSSSNTLPHNQTRNQ